MINISIVTYNHSEKEIEDLILSLQKYSSKLIDKIFIVDNSPVKKFCKLCRKYHLELIEPVKNIGFGSAHNLAIQQSLTNQKNKFHLVLNPDIQIESDVLSIIVNYMKKHPEVGVLMPRVIYGDGEMQYLSKLLPTPMDLIFRRFFNFGFLKKIALKRNESYELRNADYSKNFEAPVVSGCFMVLKKDALQELGMFDERYFMYLEDVDLCRRLGDKYKVMYFAGAEVKHGYQKGSYKSGKLLFYHTRSAILYFNKWGWFFDTYRHKKNKAAIQNIKSA